jgi:prepilin-type N-terminal cleavage/methylation domain-containing protein
MTENIFNTAKQRKATAMRRVLKRKKGMTLIEIMVGSMLFGLVVMTVTAAMSPMLRAFTRANDLAEYNLILDNAGNTIVSDMAQASDVRGIATDTVTLEIDTMSIVYSVVDGSLRRSPDGGANSTLVFPEGFYKGKSVSFDVSGTAPDFFVAVTVSSEGSSAVITRTYAVRPLLMQ